MAEPIWQKNFKNVPSWKLMISQACQTVILWISVIMISCRYNSVTCVTQTHDMISVWNQNEINFVTCHDLISLWLYNEVSIVCGFDITTCQDVISLRSHCDIICPNGLGFPWKFSPGGFRRTYYESLDFKISKWWTQCKRKPFANAQIFMRISTWWFSVIWWD